MTPPSPAVPILGDARRRRADRARQVADVLRHQVLSGTFPGGVLPREEQLCRDFDASRNTVREALALLVGEGLVERVTGIGTTVVTGKYPHGLHRLMGLAETLRSHGDITNEVRVVALTRAPTRWPAGCGWPPTTRWSTSSDFGAWAASRCRST